MTFFMMIYFIAPVAVSALFTRARAIEVVHSYFLWGAILFGLGLLMGNTPGEKLGWPLISGMFLTIPAIPILIVIRRATGLQLPWFTF